MIFRFLVFFGFLKGCLASGRPSNGSGTQFWPFLTSRDPQIIFLNPFQPTFEQFSTFLLISTFWNPTFFERKRSIPCGRSGQSLLWKMMPYWISLYEVFTPRCRKHRFLQCLLQVFSKKHFSILSHLRAFSPGFCVYDTIILYSWKIMNRFLENHDAGRQFHI